MNPDKFVENYELSFKLLKFDVLQIVRTVIPGTRQVLAGALLLVFLAAVLLTVAHLESVQASVCRRTPVVICEYVF